MTWKQIHEVRWESTDPLYTVDTVVQKNHVKVDITTVGVDEMVTTDSQTVTIA